MVLRLVGAATLVDGPLDVRVRPAFVDRHHPLAAVEGAFNAVMLQGDAIREITLEGPGAGGIETASAVVADMVSVIGTRPTASSRRRLLARARAPSARRLAIALRRPSRGRRPAGGPRRRDAPPGDTRHLRRAPHPVRPAGAAALHVVMHEAAQRALEGALAEIAELSRSRSAVPPPGDLRSRRCRPRLVVTRKVTCTADPPFSRPPAGRRTTPIARSARGPRRSCTRRGCQNGWAPSSTSSGRDRPDRELQGSRDDGGGLEGVGARRARGHLRIDGEHRASAAAYAARAGLTAVVLQPEGAVARPSSLRRARSARACSRCAVASTTRSRPHGLSARALACSSTR